MTTTTSFKVVKNVDENYSVILPSGFNQNLPPTGHIYAYPRFVYTTDIDNGLPTFSINPTTSISITSPIVTFGASTLTAGSAPGGEYTYNTNAGDCDLLTGNSSSFSNNGINLHFGNGDGKSGNNYKSWIPFEGITGGGSVPIGTTISYATVTFVSRGIGQEDSNVGIQISTEILSANWPGDHSNYPTSYNDLNARVFDYGDATVLASPMGLWGNGNTFTYDITPSVQAAINASTWKNGLAVMVYNYNSGTGNWNYQRQAFSYDNGSSYPVLTIGF